MRGSDSSLWIRPSVTTLVRVGCTASTGTCDRYRLGHQPVISVVLVYPHREGSMYSQANVNGLISVSIAPCDQVSLKRCIWEAWRFSALWVEEALVITACGVLRAVCCVLLLHAACGMLHGSSPARAACCMLRAACCALHAACCALHGWLRLITFISENGKDLALGCTHHWET